MQHSQIVFRFSASFAALLYLSSVPSYSLFGGRWPFLLSSQVISFFPVFDALSRIDRQSVCAESRTVAFLLRLTSVTGGQLLSFVLQDVNSMSAGRQVTYLYSLTLLGGICLVRITCHVENSPALSCSACTHRSAGGIKLRLLNHLVSLATWTKCRQVMTLTFVMESQFCSCFPSEYHNTAHLGALLPAVIFVVVFTLFHTALWGMHFICCIVICVHHCLCTSEKGFMLACTLFSIAIFYKWCSCRAQLSGATTSSGCLSKPRFQFGDF